MNKNVKENSNPAQVKHVVPPEVLKAISNLPHESFRDMQRDIIKTGVTNYHTEDYDPLNASELKAPLLPTIVGEDDEVGYVLTREQFEENYIPAAQNVVLLHNDPMSPAPVATPYHVFRQMSNGKDIAMQAMINSRMPFANSVIDSQNKSLDAIYTNRFKFLLRSVYIGLVDAINKVCEAHDVHINLSNYNVMNWVNNTINLVYSEIDSKPEYDNDKIISYMYNEVIIPEIISHIYDTVDNLMADAIIERTKNSLDIDATRIHAHLLNLIFDEFVSLQNNLMIVCFTIRYEYIEYFDKYIFAQQETEVKDAVKQIFGNNPVCIKEF